ncbi:hypothetical protein [Xanthobacter autotrophicus]|uniref:hypothetical protein n=1 Tax=Xanthobacter autotrophicus TaxID=280 RepID=UPI00372BA918
MNEEKSVASREAAVRRAWAKVTDGYGSLMKAPRVHWTRLNRGDPGYMLASDGYAVFGDDPLDHCATLEEVEEYVRLVQAEQKASAAA